MSFSPKTWTTGNKVTSSDLNRIEQGIANAGSEYDLVITVLWGSSTASDFSVTVGDILDCEAKIANGEPVNAVCIGTSDWSYTPANANSNKDRFIIPLARWDCPYKVISFSTTCFFEGLSNISLDALRVTIIYDPDDGSITNARTDNCTIYSE